MPVIRDIYYTHPQTGVPGLWLWLVWGNQAIVELSDTQIKTLVPTTDSVTTRPACFRTAMIGAFQPKLKMRIPLSNWTAEEQAMPVEEYCRKEEIDYLAQVCLEDFEIISLNPLCYNVTIFEEVSRGQFA